MHRKKSFLVVKMPFTEEKRVYGEKIWNSKKV